jgi:hypothetical protein
MSNFNVINEHCIPLPAALIQLVPSNLLHITLLHPIATTLQSSTPPAPPHLFLDLDPNFPALKPPSHPLSCLSLTLLALSGYYLHQASTLTMFELVSHFRSSFLAILFLLQLSEPYPTMHPLSFVLPTTLPPAAALSILAATLTSI